MESDIDRRRRLGAEAFESEMVALGRKADDADVAWRRYVEGCRANVTHLSAFAAAADRDWLALAGAQVVQTEWTEACAEAGTFFSLVRQVKSGMCVAEGAARRAFVLPGTRRNLRQKYRLEWMGWDRTCID